MLVLGARRLQRHARDGADPRARRRDHGRRGAHAAARGARRARPARVLAGRPAAPSRGAAAAEPRCGARSPRASRARPGADRRAASPPLLVAGALGNLGGREPLDFSEAFRDPPESVRGAAGDPRPLHPRPRRAACGSSRGFDAAPHVIARADERRRDARSQEMYLMAALACDGGRRSRSREAYLGMDPFSDAATDAVPGAARGGARPPRAGHAGADRRRGRRGLRHAARRWRATRG